MKRLVLNVLTIIFMAFTFIAFAADGSDGSTITMSTALSGTVKIGLSGLSEGRATIDWGDNTQPETVSLTGYIVGHEHSYNNTTPRTITITATSGIINSLVCSNNQLTNLDVSNNTGLELLNCNGNQLTSLDVSKNTRLINLSCADNRLTSLTVNKNVSDKTALTTLYAGNNQLTSLDVSKTILSRLDVRNNKLTAGGLNAMFESLPFSTAGGGTKIIYLGDNPGTTACNGNIASGKDWRYEPAQPRRR
jgi:Leucine-rich repeat (LRR) protein